MQHEFLRKIKYLAIALSISCALNVALAVGWLYWINRETPPRPYCELKPASSSELQTPLALDHSNSRVIRYFRSLSSDLLIAKLDSPQLVENGYAERDLALACLVAFHHFDLRRALGLTPQQSLQRRGMIYGRNAQGLPVKLIAFPGLSTQQFQAVVQFAKAERWPCTAHGLYIMLQQRFPQCEESLIDAFVLTSEFQAVEVLFKRTKEAIPREELVKMVLEGSWEMVSEFKEQQNRAQDLSPARRQSLLLDYLDAKSKTAAMLLLTTDPQVALKKLDDQRVCQLLALLDDKSPKAERFALALLVSPRSNRVWQEAARRLYGYVGESCPSDCSPQMAVARFAPHIAKQLAQRSAPAPKPPIVPEKEAVAVAEVVVQNPPPLKAPELPTARLSKPPAAPKVAPKTAASQTAAPKERLYIVQKGDTLWKIARRFHVDVALIKRHNKLSSDSIKEGAALWIP
jgi:LysM repeat protein